MRYPKTSMKWLANTINPEKATPFLIPRKIEETPQQAYDNWLNWVKRNRVGRPQATKYLSVEELESMGMVGIYSPEK